MHGPRDSVFTLSQVIGFTFITFSLKVGNICCNNDYSGSWPDMLGSNPNKLTKTRYNISP
jgi:hypothetical protein